MRGQAGGTAFGLMFGLMFLIVVYALMGSFQNFASASVSGNSYPTEVNDLIYLAPFALAAAVTFGVVAFLSRPSLGF